MRLASTLAITHDGRSETLSGLSVPLEAQKAELKKLVHLRSHPVYALVVYQETDSNEPARKIRFAPEPATTPADLKKKGK